jgi:hypothetical protein
LRSFSFLNTAIQVKISLLNTSLTTPISFIMLCLYFHLLQNITHFSSVFFFFCLLVIKNVLFSFCVFVSFPIFSITDFFSLWLKNIVYIISVLSNVLWLEVFSVLESALHVLLRSTCFIPLLCWLWYLLRIVGLYCCSSLLFRDWSSV